MRQVEESKGAVRRGPACHSAYHTCHPRCTHWQSQYFARAALRRHPAVSLRSERHTHPARRQNNTASDCIPTAAGDCRARRLPCLEPSASDAHCGVLSWRTVPHCCSLPTRELACDSLNATAPPGRGCIAAASKRFSVKLLRLKELEGGAERLTAEVERLRPLEQRCAELEAAAAAAAARHSVRSSALCRGVPFLTHGCCVPRCGLARSMTLRMQ